jgi:hypothetical protein
MKIEGERFDSVDVMYSCLHYFVINCFIILQKKQQETELKLKF